MRKPIDRRQFLAGQVAARSGRPSHISSALVLAFPDRHADIAERIARLPDTEVHGIVNGKIVVVLEGADVGEIGERLTAISLMDGVLAANLVFEQYCETEAEG